MDEKEQRGTDIWTYLDIIWRRKWFALPVLFVVWALTIFFTRRAAPVYEARATIMLESGVGADLFGTQPFYLWQPSQIQNHSEVLKSRSFAEIVASEMPVELKNYINRTLPGVNLAGLVQGSISVNPLKETEIIQLACRGPDRVVAQGLVNAVAETYQDYNLLQRRQVITAVKQFVEEQQQAVGERLKSAEEKVQSYREVNKILSIDQQIGSIVSQQSGFQTMRQQVASDQEVTQKKLAYLNGLLEKEQSGLSQKVSGVSSPVIANLKNSLNRLEIERTNLLIQGFTESASKIKALDGQIKEIREKMKAELSLIISRQGTGDIMGQLESIFESVFAARLDLEVLQARAEFLDSRAKEFEREFLKLPAQQREFAQMLRDVDVNQRIYSLLSEKAEEARITEAGRLANIRILDLARGAHQVQTKTRNTFLSGLFLGLFLAIGLAFLLEFLDTSIKNKRDLERVTKTPVLARIPDLNYPQRFHILKRIFKRQENIVTYLLTHTDPKTSGAEAFRMLRTSLQYASADKPLRSLLITSPGPQEGKSTVSVNLGIVMAQAGAKTLLIDADLRRPELYRVFKCEKKPGFTDLVMMGKEGDGGILKTDVENLEFLPCGTIPPSPADFLDSKAVNNSLVRLGQSFRYVILDSAPVLAVSDTSILASKVDGAIVVVRAGKTLKNGLQETVNVLTSAGIKIIGIVLNGIQPSARGYGHYYYYRYRYQSSEKK